MRFNCVLTLYLNHLLTIKSAQDAPNTATKAQKGQLYCILLHHDVIPEKYRKLQILWL